MEIVVRIIHLGRSIGLQLIQVAMPRRLLLRILATIADRRRMPSGRLNGTGTRNHQ
jgi:hypothetical protein